VGESAYAKASADKIRSSPLRPCSGQAGIMKADSLKESAFSFIFLTTDFADLHRFCLTAERKGRKRSFSQLGVLDTAHAPNAVCALVSASRPPRFVVQLRRAGKANCVVLMCKPAETG
jgi:hypothetical protein